MKKAIIATLLIPQGIYAIGGVPPWPSIQENNNHIESFIRDAVVIIDKDMFLNSQQSFEKSFCIVVDSETDPIPGCYILNTLEEAITFAETNYPEKNIFFMGGKNIWTKALAYVDSVYLTKIRFPENYVSDYPKSGPIEMFYELLILGNKWMIEGFRQHIYRTGENLQNVGLRIIYVDFIYYKKVRTEDIPAQD